MNTKRRDKRTYEDKRWDLLSGKDDLKVFQPGCFMNFCREITKMGVPPGNHKVVKRLLSMLKVQQTNVAWFCVAKMRRGVLQV